MTDTLTAGEMRAIREGLGLTQEEMARELGYRHGRTVRNFEAGAHAPPGAAVRLYVLLRDGHIRPGTHARPRTLAEILAKDKGEQRE